MASNVSGKAAAGIGSTNITKGARGPQGVQGVAAEEGGFEGTQGAQGAQGDTGDAGVQGAQGTQGATGAQGVQGTQGVQGAQGAQGDTGDAGVQGAQGAQGAQGTTGTKGAQGNQGIQGATGAQGAQGAQGNRGTFGTGSLLATARATMAGSVTVNTDTYVDLQAVTVSMVGAVSVEVIFAGDVTLALSTTVNQGIEIQLLSGGTVVFGPIGVGLPKSASGNVRTPALVLFSEAAPVSTGTREYKVQGRRTGAGGGVTNRHLTLKVFGTN